ncbi:hypothetical protein BU15DRAFT_63338 [Melanogaster broomeanus]|nr:hypothetical protein BU15DRAFT_63338 [Melanogaster broomeanus]
MSQRVGGDWLTQGAFPKWKAVPQSALHRTCGGDLALNIEPGVPSIARNGRQRGAVPSPPHHHTPCTRTRPTRIDAYTARAPAYQSSSMVETSADNPGNALQATREEPYTKVQGRAIDKWPYPTFQPVTTTAELLSSRRLSQMTPAFTADPDVAPCGRHQRRHQRKGVTGGILYVPSVPLLLLHWCSGEQHENLTINECANLMSVVPLIIW